MTDSIELVKGEMAPAPQEGFQSSMQFVNNLMDQVFGPEEAQNVQKQFFGRFSHHYSQLQPWRSFIFPVKVKFTKWEDTLSAAKENLAHFQMNYALLFLTYLAFSILFNPSSLVIICVIGVCWGFFLKKNADPEWNLAVAGITVGAAQRRIVMMVLTAIMVLIFLGNTIIGTSFVFGIFAVAHACVKIPPSTLGSEAYLAPEDDEV